MGNNLLPTDTAASPRSLRAVRILGALGFAAGLGMLLLADGRPAEALQNTDFVSLFYVAGKLILSGRGGALYAGGAEGPWPRAFDAAAHAELPGLPGGSLYTLVYPPPAVVLLAPAAWLTPSVALFVFQLASLLALAAAAALFARAPGGRAGGVELVVSAFSVLFVGELLFMGQPGLVLGLLPMVAGYCLWLRERPLAAGLAWSLLALKVQLAIPVALLVVALAAARWREGSEARREPLRIAAGLALGGLGLAVLPLPVLGMGAYRDWLATLREAQRVLGHPQGIDYATHLIGSIPEAIAASGGAWGAGLGAAASIAGGVGALWAMVGLARTTPEPATRRDLLVAVAVLALFATAPYLRLYDTWVLVLPLWIGAFRLPLGSPAQRRLIGVVLALIAVVDLDFLRLWFGFAASS